MTIHPAVSDLGEAFADPANDVPASTTVRASSLPQAPVSGPSPAILAAGDRLATLLPMAVQSLEGKELAVFEWQTVTGNDGQTSVSASGCDLGSFELVWTHGAARQSVRVKAEINCTRHDELVLRLKVGAKLRAWVLATSESVDRWLDGESMASVLPNPRGANGLEYLGHVWFSDGAVHESGVTQRGGSAPWRLPSVGRAWPRFRVKNSKRTWEVPAVPKLDGAAASDWGGAIAAVSLWTLLTLLFQEAHDEGEPGADAFGLPSQKEYFPQRAVNLNGSEVLAQLKQDAYGLRIPWHVIEAACASLNSGKHVLFTGPPGCGKSKLAIALSQLATGRRPLLVTASPAWTSGDLIGRYLPSRTGHGLTFVPGAFLRAAEEERWLVVDEFNRANIDECFGELFSVLANDTVELPFEGLVSKDGTNGTEQYAPVRIVPAVRASEEASNQERAYCDYQVSPSFRLVGTMNDSDRAKLHQLSFALQRRFDVIRVEAPPWNVVREVIDQEMTRMEKTLRHAYKFFQKTAARTMERRIDLCKLKEEYLYGLFACDPSQGKRGDVIDLVSERVIGLATVRDVMSFVAEGLRGPVGHASNAHVALPEDMTTHDVATSYVAMGLVLSVFPQLEAVEPARQIAVIRFIVDLFRNESGDSLPLLRLTTVDDGEEQFTAERVRASDGNVIDQDADTWISIPEYMVSELVRQFKGSIPERDILDIIRREPQPADGQ
jgi:energy-coupling factor transporter ATP-binding protein EcfA2